jgi:hypothetical protein
MDDLIDGTIDGWPCSILIERAWARRKGHGAHCCPYRLRRKLLAPQGDSY